MTGTPGFLEFFILEAGEYVEQLDALVLADAGDGPDAGSVQRVARALRGTATMAKLTPFADVAAGIERAGRAMHEGALPWDAAVSAALVAAIDDLKILLRSARSWAAADDQRAAACVAELQRLAPQRRTVAAQAGVTAAGPASGAALPSAAYLAAEAANIAAGLELLTTRVGDADTAANVLRRVRALRGVAGVKELGPLADALEATEDAARPLESSREPMTDEARRILESAAAYLRVLAQALREGTPVEAPSAARDAFVAARAEGTARDAQREVQRDRVVPIEDLFYADGSAGLVESAANPPTTAPERFRLELVSLGEHLRQVVDAGRSARDADAVARARRDLRRALTALEQAAESFREHAVGEFIRGHADAADHLDFLGLASLDALAAVLADPGAAGERLAARLRELAGGQMLSSAIGAGFGEAIDATGADTSLPPLVSANAAPAAALRSAAAPTPSPARPSAPPPASPPRATPPRHLTPVRTRSLDVTSVALIDSSIAALESLADQPFSAPVALPEDVVVPIESLLYRGRAALDRAVEIRDELRHRGGQTDSAALEELFDLLELARAE
jgi:chemotaxis protein histidine kinase CheA